MFPFSGMSLTHGRRVDDAVCTTSESLQLVVVASPENTPDEGKRRMSGFVGSSGDTPTDADRKRKAREARFKQEAAKPPPPKPKRTMAHAGGKVTHNKEAALAAYLKRKAGRLTPQQQEALNNLEHLKNKVAPVLVSEAGTGAVAVATVDSGVKAKVMSIEKKVADAVVTKKPPPKLDQTKLSSAGPTAADRVLQKSAAAHPRNQTAAGTQRSKLHSHSHSGRQDQSSPRKGTGRHLNKKGDGKAWRGSGSVSQAGGGFAGATAAPTLSASTSSSNSINRRRRTTKKKKGPTRQPEDSKHAWKPWRPPKHSWNLASNSETRPVNGMGTTVQY